MHLQTNRSSPPDSPPLDLPSQGSKTGRETPTSGALIGSDTQRRPKQDLPLADSTLTFAMNALCPESTQQYAIRFIDTLRQQQLLIEVVEQKEAHRAALSAEHFNLCITQIENFCTRCSIGIEKFKEELDSTFTPPYPYDSHFDEVKQTMKKLNSSKAALYCDRIDSQVNEAVIQQFEKHIKDVLPPLCLDAMGDFCTITGVTIQNFINDMSSRWTTQQYSKRQEEKRLSDQKVTAAPQDDSDKELEYRQLFMDTINALCPEDKRSSLNEYIKDLTQAPEKKLEAHNDDTGFEDDVLSDLEELPPFFASATNSGFNTFEDMNGDQESGVSKASNSGSRKRRRFQKSYPSAETTFSFTGNITSPPSTPPPILTEAKAQPCSSRPPMYTEKHQNPETLIKRLTSRLQKNVDVKNKLDEMGINIKENLSYLSWDELRNLKKRISRSSDNSQKLIDIIINHIVL